MGKMKDALIRLAKKVSGKDLDESNKDSMSNVISFMADNYEGGGGGGSSYTAGNGIHINNNKISADVKVVEAENISGLSSELLNSLNAGDMVNVPGLNPRVYSVVCRGEYEIQLESPEAIAIYLKTVDSDWTFDSLFIKGVEANPTLSGDEPELTGLQIGLERYKVPKGGSGGISGAYMIPGAYLSAESLGIEDSLQSFKIDYNKVADYLEAAGIDVDATFITEQESEESAIFIGHTERDAPTSEGHARVPSSILDINFENSQGQCLVSIRFLNNTTGERGINIQIPVGTYTIREALALVESAALEFNFNVTVSSIFRFVMNPEYNRAIVNYTNEIMIVRYFVNDYEYSLINDVKQFVLDILIPEGSGSATSEVGN